MDFEKLTKERNEGKGFAQEIGIVTTEVREGFAQGEIELEPRHLNALHSVHGGCIFSLADSIGGACALSRGHYVVTLSSTINYLNMAKHCRKIVATAQTVKWGYKTIVVDVDIWDDNQVFVAKITNTYYNTGRSVPAERSRVSP